MGVATYTSKAGTFESVPSSLNCPTSGTMATLYAYVVISYDLLKNLCPFVVERFHSIWLLKAHIVSVD